MSTYPDTITPHPDTPRQNSDTPRHRHCYAIQGTERKCNIWVSWPNIFFANRFGIDASQDTLRHHLDIIQTPSDTIQTPPDIDVFAIEGTGRKGNIRVWPNLNFANGFGIAISWYHDILVLIHSQTLSDPIQTPSRHPQTPSRHPQTKAFLCYIGHYIKGKFSVLHKNTFVWRCLVCVSGCLDVVWMGFESVLGCINTKSVDKEIIIGHGTQILSFIPVPCIA